MHKDIKIGQDFINEGTRYNCVGHDELFILGKMVWGVNNETQEALPFDPHNCTPISEFTLNIKQ